MESEVPQDRGNVTDLPARPAREIRKSHKLDHVCYEIRGPAMKEADRMEEEGHRIIKVVPADEHAAHGIADLAARQLIAE